MEKSTRNTSVSQLANSDQRSIWRPYTQEGTAAPPIPIARAEGAYLYDTQGRRYFDAMSSWWVNLHGHAHPHIADALAKQAATLEHVMFADFTHAPATDLATRLLKLLPKHLSRIFYSDNGSTAVETALKIALQYHYNKNSSTKRKRIVALRHGFHGETIAAMSASERGLFSRPFESVLIDVDFIDPPFLGCEEESLKQLKAILEDNDTACFIFEPYLQGVGGMRTHSIEGLDQLLALCRKNDVVTIADEVLTGFGRTGPLFVSNELDHCPDMVCLAKALTGGFVPLGATICAEYLFDAFSSESREKALLHGHSYTANPIGCAAAIANLELLEQEACTRYRHNIEQQHRSFAEEWGQHPGISRCEVIGTMLAIDYKTDEKSSYFNTRRDRLARFFLDNGVLIRPFGNMIHVMPPYCTQESELEQAYRVIIETLENPTSI